jgi:L-alanine-DL-glutamate epimerase-like enolase superfamily enzyme
MKIESATAELYGLPLKEPWAAQSYRIDEIEIVVVRLKADDGTVGDGFTWTVGVGGPAIKKVIESELIPRLVGKEASPRPRWHELWRGVHDAGGGGLTTIALGAIDIGLWDLQGKRLEMPLTQMLGTCRDAIPAYGSGINLNRSIEELEDQARRWLELGYKGAKIKVGIGDPYEDRKRVQAVRNVVGHLPLMVDANQGWNVTQALQACHLLEGLELTWLEEPLVADDLLGHARLRAATSVPIAVGEDLYNIYDFNQYLALSACDFVQPDVARVGGITPFLDIAALTQAWNVPLAPHFMMEITGQLLCCLPTGLLLEDVEGGSLSELGALKQEIRVEDGMFHPPMVPGHGVVFDFDRIAAFRKSD